MSSYLNTEKVNSKKNRDLVRVARNDLAHGSRNIIYESICSEHHTSDYNAGKALFDENVVFYIQNQVNKHVIVK